MRALAQGFQNSGVSVTITATFISEPPWASAYQMIMTPLHTYLITQASTNHVLVRVFTTAKHLREKVYNLRSLGVYMVG